MVGGIAELFDANWNGVVLQAVLATIAVFAATLMLFASGKVRASARMTQVFFIGLNGMILYAVAAILWRWLGLSSSPLGLDTDIKVVGVPLGAIVGVIGVLLRAYGFVMDFDFIKANAESAVPERYSWAAAFCLLVRPGTGTASGFKSPEQPMPSGPPSARCPGNGRFPP